KNYYMKLSTVNLFQKMSLLLVLSLLLTPSLSAQKKNIKVTNAQEFLRALGSNRVLLMAPGVYDFSDLMDAGGDHHYFKDAYDGQELWIRGTDNLTIKSADPKQIAEFVTQPQYGNVLAFENCKNITIENIEAGHGASKGSCTGGVLFFSQVSNVQINNCLLYGSGIEGITTSSVDGLTARNVRIRGCTYGIMTIEGSENIRFENCSFTDNMEFDLINIIASPKVTFKNCVISQNQTGIESYSDYSLFKFQYTGSAILNNTLVKYNRSAHLTNDKGKLEVKNSQIRNNYYAQGMYKDE
ncbi:MAG: right-handed parallel beta-helix repeat-containing protein, partial [Bacteroidota bacterium]